ncbi:MAG: LytR C-terminal domain-containing protein, partial [Thermoleophilaceae bacterium]
AAPAAAAAQAQPAGVGGEGNGQGTAVKEGATPPAAAQGAGTAPPAREGEEEKPAEAAPATGASQAPAEPAGNAGAAQATPAPSGEGAAQRPIPRPAPQRLPAPRPGAARRIPPLPGSTQARPPWYRRLAPRYIVLLVAGVLVLGAGAAFGIATLAGDGGETASDGPGGEPPAGADSSAPLDPSTIEVAVLNGTSISGAAQSVSGTVEQAGFQIGNVANATEQTSAESAVLFAEGARSAAREVGRELGISQLEPVGTDTQDLAGTADVVVVVGADQAE